MISAKYGKRIVLIALLAVAGTLFAQSPTPDNVQRISAAELAAILHGSGPKPLILSVGPERLYRTAHIQGAEYAGMAAEPAGLQELRERVQKLKRTAEIVIYCGCCPWQHCPNIHPAYNELRKMGFTHVKALYLPNNFKTDWDDAGYPTNKGV